MAAFWDLDRVERPDGPVGSDIFLYSETASTNAEALAHIRNGTAVTGQVLLAEEQTLGRGRRKRTWYSAPGMGIWMTVVLAPSPFDSNNALLNMGCALAVADAVDDACGLRAGLKWPNDVWVNGRKVCGILIESGDRGGRLAVGMGINVGHTPDDFPEDIRQTATSLALEAGWPVEREKVLSALLDSLNHYYELVHKGREEKILAAYRKKSLVLGRKVAVNGHPAGSVRDIAADGALIIKDEQGEMKRIIDGEIDFADLNGNDK